MPPRARMVPSITVATSDQSTAVPPLPLLIADTSMTAPGAMVTVCAWASVPPPCASPPTSTVPPPVAPLASITELSARVMLSPTSLMTPPTLTRDDAETVPLLLIAAPSSLSAALAAMMTRPSSAATRCLFSMRVAIVAGSTVTPSRLSPLKSRVVLSPAARAMVPSFAEMIPSLRTSGARRATKPPDAAVMVPWLRMLPTELPR